MEWIASRSKSKSKRIQHSCQRHACAAPSPWLSRSVRSKTINPETVTIRDVITPQDIQKTLMDRIASSHDIMRHAKDVAKDRFGWARLKQFQSDAVIAWANGQHSFVVAGTGRGKSACFQVPGIVGWELAKRNGVAHPIVLVISPLVALMRDQVEKLRAHGIRAVVLGGQAREDDPHAWARAMQGEVAIAYMSPEFAVGHVEALRSMPNVSMLAIDEAHTIFEWGQTFRLEYGSLNKVHEALCLGARQRGEGAQVPIMCLTATCTSEVREHVLTSLHIPKSDVAIILGTSNRPNLMFSVLEMPSKDAMRSTLLKILTCRRGVGRNQLNIEMGPSVVYTRRRMDCSELAQFLIEHGIKAVGYHGGMPDHVRSERQRQFQDNRVQVMVATAAFGMGIDKCDIRRVIHYGLPSSIEVYIQECGRAGRDGQRSECIALFTRKCRMLRERTILNDRTAFPEIGDSLKSALSRLQKIDSYFRNHDRCRRAQLLEHIGEDPCAPLLSSSQAAESMETSGFCHRLGEGPISCKLCDVCCSVQKQCKGSQDCREGLRILLKIALLYERRNVSATTICSIAGGYVASSPSPLRKYPGFGLGANLGFARKDWSLLMEAAVDSGYMERLPMQALAGKRFLVLRTTSLGRHLSAKKSSQPFLVDLDRKRALPICSINAPPVICIRAAGRDPQPPAEMNLAAVLPLQGHLSRECQVRSAHRPYPANGWIQPLAGDASNEPRFLTPSRAGDMKTKDLRSQIMHEISAVQDADFLGNLLTMIQGQKVAQKATPAGFANKACKKSDTAENQTTPWQKRKLPWVTFASGAAAASKRAREI